MMKLFYTLLLLLGTNFSLAQYDDYGIGSGAGFAFSLNEEGNGSSFSFDIHKHIGLGIYGVISYGRGHLTKGIHYNSESAGVPGYFHADNMRQYNNFGLGIKKILLLSPVDKLSMSFSGVNSFQRVMSWNLVQNAWGDLDLEESQEKYGQRSDLGFHVSLDYLHCIDSNLSIGFYADYNSEPKHVNVGLRSMLTFSKKENKELQDRPVSKIVKKIIVFLSD